MAVNCETDKVYLVDNSKNQIPVVIPEFPSWVILPIFFVVTLVGVVVRRKVFCPA